MQNLPPNLRINIRNPIDILILGLDIELENDDNKWLDFEIILKK